MDHYPPKPTCYRLKRSFRNIAFICLVFYSAMAIGTPLIFLTAPDEFPRPVVAAIFFGSFWSGWVLLSLWILAAYYRHELIIAGGTITQQGVIRRRSLSIADVSSVRWRKFPRQGSVVLQTDSTRIKIPLGDFEPPEQVEIIEWIREHTSPAIAEGWDGFVKVRQPPRPLPPSRWVAAGCGFCFLATGVVFTYLWLSGMGIHLGLTALFCFAVAIWYAVRIARFQPHAKPIA